MIASPTPGVVTTVYMKTILATMGDLASNGIYCRFETQDGSDLPLLRNILATRFYESDCTHLLCVDSDMMFRETMCRRMLGYNKPIIGTIYAGKMFYLGRMAAAMEKGFTLEQAFTFATDWIGSARPDLEKIEVTNGIVEAAPNLGMGAVLISRNALDIMISRAKVKRQIATNEASGHFYNFFTLRGEDAEANQHVSEDSSFYRRWVTDCGGTLWALVDEPVLHVGAFGFGGSYFEHLKAISEHT